MFAYKPYRFPSEKSTDESLISVGLENPILVSKETEKKAQHETNTIGTDVVGKNA